MAGEETILWRRLDRPGHEAARLFRKGEGWNLAGTAVFAHEGKPCRPDYSILCDSAWLGLAVGGEATDRAAWLRFPSFALEPLEQSYRRLAPSRYRYESAGGRFVAEIEVNAAGLVTLYPEFWQAERCGR